MPEARPVRRGRWRSRALIVAALPLVVIACLNDRPSGQGGSARASFNLRKVARGGAACGPAPMIVLARARVLLRVQGHSDSVVGIANFVGDSATLTADIPLAGNSALVNIDAQAIDSSGDTVFRARDTATAKAGDRIRVGYLNLWYAAPDSALQTLMLQPRDSMVHENAVFPMRATGTVNGGGAFTGRIRLAFVSRDPTLAAVTGAGGITVQKKIGTVYIVASTWLGICDSTTVNIVPPVASIVVTPDTMDIPRGGTVQMVAVTKDSAGNVLVGRKVVWTTTNANISVDTTGLVKGLVARQSGEVIGTSEGKADTSGIGVLPKPVGKVTITPKPGSVNQGATLQLSAAVVDSQGQPNPDFPVVWASLNPAQATVNATGLVSGVAGGPASITATAGGVADTSVITVIPVGITSTVVTPTPDTMVSINDSLQLVAKSYTGATLTAGTYTWTSRDPTVVSVSNTGIVVAKANGSTFVVAVEAGGTKDSAHVFVIQKVSAISVTPTPVQRYLGTKQQFAAAAVDARGSAVAGTVFTWSSSDPSIAVPDPTGLVPTMLAIGTDTVKATVGTVVGKATLTVISAITRIAVTPTPVTLVSIAQTQTFTAVAHDTLDAVMPGINFTWVSTNPGVATVPGTVGTTQVATAAGNGITAITASAQSVNGSAALTVAQQLVSIVAGPSPTTVGQGGQAQLTAHGKDANGFFIPGGSFTWTSDAPTNVSVGAATGIVKGVAVPPSSAHITAASGAITSNQVLVLVDNSVPPKVSWGKDTLAIGRGSLNNSLPLYLSKPNAATITINVAVKDTFAFFSPTSVTFAAGATTANANLDGRNAGITQVYATDPSSQYLGDTAVLLVQANAKFTLGGYNLNALDYQPTQVLLTDPAPAGGVYLAMSYGTAGIAQISPDPAFIPVGQLAANVNLNGLAAGSTTITPTSTGVSGTSSNVNVSAPVLFFSSGTPRVIGAGQYEPGDYVYVSQYLFHVLPVGLVSSDTTIVNSAPTDPIPAGTNFQRFTFFAYRVGQVIETASSPGWTSAVRTVISSTPKFYPCCNNTINTTTGPVTAGVSVGDTVGSGHPRINPLFVSVQSSDTTVVAIVDTLVTIAAGSSNTNARYKPGGNGGVAYVRFVAGGHKSDSIKIVVNAPQLSHGFSQYRIIGHDQSQVNFGYVQIPNAVGSAVQIHIASADTTIAYVTPLLTIPAGSNTVYFDVHGHSIGSVKFLITATGYAPDSDSIIVTTPRLVYCCGANVPNFYPDFAMTQYAADSLGTTHNVLSTVKVSFRPTNAAVATTDSASVNIVAGTSLSSAAKIHVVGVGTDSIIASAPGYRSDTLPVTVYMPALNDYLYVGVVGLRQRLGPSAYVYTPNARPDSVIVHVANTFPRGLLVPDSLKILKTTNVTYFDYSGVALGKATLTFTAAGYTPATGTVVVSSAVLKQGGIGATYNTTSPPVQTYVYAEDTVGYSHLTLDSVSVHVTSTDTTVMKVDSQYIHIFKGQSLSTYENVRFIGPGTARIVYHDSAGLYEADSTAPVTVIGPSLRISAGTTISSPVTLGMRQHLGANGMYVYVDNPVTGTPLTVNLLSTDTKVASVPATVTIAVGSTVGYFDITALDTTGTIQIKLNATGYAPVVSYVQVGQPQFLVQTDQSVYTTTAPQLIYVYAQDQASVSHYTTENVSVTLTSSNGSVAAPDSATVTIAKDNYYDNGSKMIYASAGTTVLTASDARVKFYRYSPSSTGTITVGTPPLTFQLGATNSLGLDEIIDTYVQVPNSPPSPVTVTLGHTGSATSTPASVVIPNSTNYVNFRVTAANRGTDVLSASATGYAGTTAQFVVDSGHVILNGWPATVQVGDSVAMQIYAEDPSGNFRDVGVAVTFTLAPNANIVFHAGGAVVTSITIPAGAANSGTFYLKGVTSGVGSATATGGRFIVYSNSLTVNP